MIAQPERLECLMRVIRSIDPCVVVVSEVEANHNSLVFVNRFIEALFYFSAFFDCLEACLNQDLKIEVLQSICTLGMELETLWQLMETKGR